jgi:hypothetical protein
VALGTAAPVEEPIERGVSGGPGPAMAR